MEQIKQTVEDGSVQVSEMVAAIVGTQTQEIDSYVDQVRTLFLSNCDIPDADLDKIILQIPVLIFHLIRVLQEIDIRKGVASESAKFSEHEALMEATGTVSEKQAKASNATIKNRIVGLAYKSASSLIQAKINAAMEILSSAKKVQQRRLEEMRLTKLGANAVG